MNLKETRKTIDKATVKGEDKFLKTVINIQKYVFWF